LGAAITAGKSAMTPERKRRAIEKRRETLGDCGRSRNALAIAASKRLPDGSWSGAKKMIQTKRDDIDENGMDCYDRAAIKTAITRFGFCLSREEFSEFKKYQRRVYKITNQQPLHLLENIEKRGAHGLSADPYQLDHKFSVVQGFLNNVSPEIIGHISNLEMITARANNSKGSSCSISLEELIQQFTLMQTAE
jgi:hypothetical protein